MLAKISIVRGILLRPLVIKISLFSVLLIILITLYREIEMMPDCPQCDARGDMETHRRLCQQLTEYTLSQFLWMRKDHSLLFPEQYLVVREKRFQFCKMWKVGTQTWRSLAASLGHQQPDDLTSVLHHKDFTPEEVETMMETYKTAMFVRDPWRRLWSAYNDKFVNFHPFYLMKYRRTLSTVRTQRPKHDCLLDVTFPEFIDLVIYQFEHKKRFDNHWLPYWQLCNPCGVRYNFIGKLENFDDDFSKMIDRLDLGDSEKLKGMLLNDDYSSLWFPFQKDLFNDKSHVRMTRKYPAECLKVNSIYDAKWRSLVNLGYAAMTEESPLTISDDASLAGTDDHTRAKIVAKGVSEIRKILESHTKVEQKEMKSRIFTEAMENLNQEQICALEKIYKPDFILFGYSTFCIEEL